MRIRNTIGLLSVAAMVLAVSTESHAAASTWTGKFNVGYSYGTGTMTLQEGRLPSYVDTEMGLIGTLELNPTSGTKTTCVLEGPKSAQVRSDRVMLKGDCRKGTQRFYYALFLAKAPNAFHGFYTVSASVPAAGGIIGAVQDDFSEMSVLASIWGQK